MSAEQVNFLVDGMAAEAMLACLEGIRSSRPDLIADFSPAGWGMSRYRTSVEDGKRLHPITDTNQAGQAGK